jgi:hypothetical protein
VGTGQTVGSFGPNRPFAATLAEKAAFAGRQRHRAQGGIGRLWFFNDLQRRIPALRVTSPSKSGNYNLQKL